MSEPQSPPKAASSPPLQEKPLIADTSPAGSSPCPLVEPAGASEGPSQTLPNFHPHHRTLLRRCTAALLVILAIEWVIIATERPDPILLQRGDSFRRQFRIDVNEATWVEWIQMDGIGPSLAHRIVADRKLNGRFRTIDDVGRVPGIGPATLDRIRPWLTIHHDLSEPQFPASDSTPSLQPPADASTVGRSAGQPAGNDRKSPAF